MRRRVPINLGVAVGLGLGLGAIVGLFTRQMALGIAGGGLAGFVLAVVFGRQDDE